MPNTRLGSKIFSLNKRIEITERYDVIMVRNTMSVIKLTFRQINLCFAYFFPSSNFSNIATLSFSAASKRSYKSTILSIGLNVTLFAKKPLP